MVLRQAHLQILDSISIIPFLLVITIFADLLSVQGIYPGFGPEKLPAIPGLDGVGRVERNGPGTSGKFKPGQRVVAVSWETKKGNGSWAQ